MPLAFCDDATLLRLERALSGLVHKSAPGSIANLGSPGTTLRNRSQLQVSIRARMDTAYKTKAQAVLDELHGEGAPQFDLTAKWKTQEITAQSERMAASVANTTKARKTAIFDNPDLEPHEKAEKWADYLDAKTDQLEAMVNAEAEFQAHRDVLLHSGVIGPEDAVWYFGGSPAPCDLCSTITAGNPYTAIQASAVGANAHPNCRDDWDSDWTLGEDALGNARGRAASGEISLWTGSGRTPVDGSARELASSLRQQRPATWEAIRTKAIAQARDNGATDADIAGALRLGVRQ